MLQSIIQLQVKQVFKAFLKCKMNEFVKMNKMNFNGAKAQVYLSGYSFLRSLSALWWHGSDFIDAISATCCLGTVKAVTNQKTKVYNILDSSEYSCMMILKRNSLFYCQIICSEIAWTKPNNFVTLCTTWAEHQWYNDNVSFIFNHILFSDWKVHAKVRSES